MPLKAGKSKEVFAENVAELMHSNTAAGKARKAKGSKKARQIALAIAFDKKRES